MQPDTHDAADRPSLALHGIDDEDEGLPVVRIVLGYLGTLVLTLVSALAISGYAPDVVVTIAGL